MLATAAAVSRWVWLEPLVFCLVRPLTCKKRYRLVWLHTIDFYQASRIQFLSDITKRNADQNSSSRNIQKLKFRPTETPRKYRRRNKLTNFGSKSVKTQLLPTKNLSYLIKRKNTTNSIKRQGIMKIIMKCQKLGVSPTRVGFSCSKA